MKPYESYKSVNEVWLEQIPQNWEFKRIKNVFYNRVEKNYPLKTEVVLSLSARNGVELQSEKTDKGGNKPKSDFSKYNIAHEHDLLVNCMNVVSGSSGVSNWHGAISPVYYALHTRDESSNVRFYHYLFRFKPFYRSLLRFSKGILMHESDNGNLNTVRMRISMESLNNINIPIPPRTEQDQIVRYLDWQISKINKLVIAKKRQIELLKEQKQAVINKALFNDSSFKYAKLSICSDKIGSGKTPRGGSAVYLNSGVLFLRSQNVQNYYLSIENAYYISDEIDESMSSTRVYTGDVLLNITGGSIGRSSVYSLKDHANVNQHVCIIRTKKQLLLPIYLCYVLNSYYGQNLITQCQNTGNRESLTFVQIGQFEIPLVSIEEQQAIVDYITDITGKIDTVISETELEIELISEYKQSLISSVVTGKIDVRNVVVPEFETVEDLGEVENDEVTMEGDMDDSN